VRKLVGGGGNLRFGDFEHRGKLAERPVEIQTGMAVVGQPE